MIDEYDFKRFQAKIRQQIVNWRLEMEKKDNNFDFYEGRKIEAEVILSWSEDVKNGNLLSGVDSRGEKTKGSGGS